MHISMNVPERPKRRIAMHICMYRYDIVSLGCRRDIISMRADMHYDTSSFFDMCINTVSILYDTRSRSSGQAGRGG